MAKRKPLMSLAESLVEIYKKNLNYFQEFYPDLYFKLTSFNQQNARYELVIEDAGYFDIVHVQSGNKLYGANSEFLAQEQVNNFLQNAREIKKMVFLGILLGFHIEQFSLKSKAPCFMIIEPDLELFRLSTFIIDYEKITQQRFTIFSIQDSPEILEHKFLEFAYTMYFYNDYTHFFNIVDTYDTILAYIQKVIQENIFLQVTHNIKSIPTLSKQTNILALSEKAQKQSMKRNYYDAIDSYILITQAEQYLKVNGNSSQLQETILKAYMYLGNLFSHTRHHAEALHAYGKCVYAEFSSNNIREIGLQNYAFRQKRAGRNLIKMMTFLQNYLNNTGRSIRIAMTLSEFLVDANRYNEAQELITQYHNELLHDKRIEAFLPLIPIVYQSQNEIDDLRKQFEIALDQALQENITIDETNLSTPNVFYFAYHNRNNKTLMSKLSTFYEKTTPSLLFTANHCINNLHNEKKKKKIKIGIISNFLQPNHPVGKFMNKIITTLDANDLYDIIVFTFSREIEKSLPSKVYTLMGSFQDMRNVIAQKKCDIILYPEIGMHNVTYFLAHARLAPVQCVFGGHPVTTGITNIDYYFSQKDFLTEHAQEHYSEKLVSFENIPAIYNQPKIPEFFISKEELGLDAAKHNYLIPSKLQKLHPDFDQTLALIAQKDKKAKFIFFVDRTKNNWEIFIHERLKKHLDDTQMQFLPWAEQETFYSLLHHADTVLDPHVFGFGTTAIEAFALGVPIVTLPGDFVPGRVTYALYQQMDIQELIASDKQSYAALAIKLATNMTFKETCKTKILKSKHILYNNENFIHELDTFFQNIMQYNNI